MQAVPHVVSHWPRSKHADRNTRMSRDPSTHFTYCSGQWWTYHAPLHQRTWLNVDAKIMLPPSSQLPCCFGCSSNIKANHVSSNRCAFGCRIMIIISLIAELPVNLKVMDDGVCRKHNNCVSVINVWLPVILSLLKTLLPSKLLHIFLQVLFPSRQKVFMSADVKVLKWIFDFPDIDYIWVKKKLQRSPGVFIACLLYQVRRFFCTSIICIHCVRQVVNHRKKHLHIFCCDLWSIPYLLPCLTWQEPKNMWLKDFAKFPQFYSFPQNSVWHSVWQQTCLNREAVGMDVMLQIVVWILLTDFLCVNVFIWSNG